MAGILYLVATPIGNLGDFTPRAAETLENVDFIAAEDTRVSVKLLNHFGIKKPLVSYHEHNHVTAGQAVLSRLLGGESCALVTDAGTPAISDPGEDLVRLCAENGVEVRAVPGCCAAVNALAVSGLPTAKGSFTWENITDSQLGWAGVGQFHDQVNPCALMVYLGAIANGGRAAEPYLIKKTVSALGIPSLPHLTNKTGQLVSASTASALADMMADNVEKTYGTKRFPNMDICAKSGTAEVGEGKTPHAWFAGFLRNEETPYAFVVLVENGGGGSSVAGTVAGKVLDIMVNGY